MSPTVALGACNVSIKDAKIVVSPPSIPDIELTFANAAEALGISSHPWILYSICRNHLVGQYETEGQVEVLLSALVGIVG